MLGDVLIAPGYVKQQATDTGAAFEDEMDLMVVHGLLHLMGYDHEEPPDARLMEGRERAILGTRRRP
jgi:probable rRNA maturation factor